jgi:hypothetical protein
MVTFTELTATVLWVEVVSTTGVGALVEVVSN